MVEGRSKRVFTDTKAVVDVAVQNGYTDLYKQTLITLTEFEKMMGKKKFAELLGEYVAKPPGNRGVAAGLQNIQLVRHGERLSGKPTAASDFETIEGDDEELGEVDDDMDFLN